MSIPWPKIRINFINAFARFFPEVVIGSVVIVLAVGYFWFLRSGFQEIRLQGRYNLLESQTHKEYLRGYVADLQTLAGRYAELQKQQLSKFRDILPANPDLPGLFVQVDALAKQNGFVANAITFSDDFKPSASGASTAASVAANRAQPASVSSLGIHINITGGDYMMLKQFLASLEVNLRLLDVENITFAPSLSGQTAYDINLRTYYLPR